MELGAGLAGKDRGFPVWWAEWSHKHPSGGAADSLQAAAMTMCPGTGLLSQQTERGAGRLML